MSKDAVSVERFCGVVFQKRTLEVALYVTVFKLQQSTNGH